MQTYNLIALYLASLANFAAASPMIPSDGGSACDANCQVDTWLFSTPIDTFYTYMQSEWKDDPSTWGGVDWVRGSDDCSVPEWVVTTLQINDKNQPKGYDFRKACYRHDFGYGNYKKEGRFTEDNRGKIDNNFRKDMFDQCAKYNIVAETACKVVAEAYYTAVRNFGSK
ncbi:prokaryotic phospholipase A2-domain-containing protein [Xylariales sp. PMI_506]|nr:prokaryotic phospholipase A2-domain-containing protein [Xylariales sp. PMI_506]